MANQVHEGRADLLSPKDLADLLGVPLSTVYRWNHYGDGPKRLVLGRHVRYRMADVEKWLEGKVA